MKKAILLLTLCLISLSCAAQTIKIAQDYHGQEISYVSSETFGNIEINNTVLMRALVNVETIKDIIALFGRPLDIKSEKDVAIDGTVLFERKLVTYPGLLFVFPKKEETYKLSRIDFISNRSSLRLSGNKINVGMSTQEISNKLPNIKKLAVNENISIQVADNKPSHKLKNGTQENVTFNDKHIKINYNPATKKVEKISILMYIM